MVKECWSAAENVVAVAFYRAVFKVNRSVALQGVAGAFDGYITDDNPLAGQKQAFGLAPRGGPDGHVDQVDIAAVIDHKRRTAGGKCAGPLIGCDIGRMRVEDFVIGIMHHDFVAIFAEECYVCLVAKVDDLLVIAVFDEDCRALRSIIGDEINRSLHGIEIACSVAADDQPLRTGGRRRLFGRKGPAGFTADSGKAAAGDGQDIRIDLHVIGFVVFEEIVVRIDGRCIAVNDDGVKMKRVREAADNRQLIIVRRGQCRPGRCAGFGVGVCETAGNVLIGNLCVGNLRLVGFRRPRRDA